MARSQAQQQQQQQSQKSRKRKPSKGFSTPQNGGKTKGKIERDQKQNNGTTARRYAVGALLALTVLVIGFVGFREPMDGGEENERSKSGENEGGTNWKLLDVYAHDPTCYTQGLFVHEGILYESCGIYGESRLQMVEIGSGKVLKTTDIDDKLFAEGIDLIDGKILMLTWRENQLLEFDFESFELKQIYSFTTHRKEGWGIAFNGKVIVVTDGSEWLHIWNPETLKETNRIKAYLPQRQNAAVNLLNEIEFVNDNEILANIYGQQFLVKIDITTGEVTTIYDMRGILSKYGDDSGDPEVFNGIAYDKETGDVYVTGKRWKSMFRLRLD